ncbi:sensor histidine kinase [Micromonospora globbae]|uniref:Histidine kinase n=2 Tax=Micromonospora globbae TaxID=1894969 RepID=A0ABZ1SC19_9ACTN|nr:histidine kinase [Micromonospora globbae]WTF83755.1 histidine kinase [Micromonospora globbae]
MRRVGLDEWAGLVMLAVCLGAASPVVVGLVEPDVPPPVWVALLLTTLVAALVAVAGAGRLLPRRAAFGVAVAASWGTVLSAPQAGLLPILLVVVAALGPEVVRLPANLVVVALNTAVVAVSVSRVHDDGFQLAAAPVFYALIQLATVFSLTAIGRERRLRHELARAHVDLQAASVLLAGSARTAERLRISRELHDLIGHQLTVLTLELEAARHRTGESAREHVERANQVARDVLADVRVTVGALRAAPATDLAQALRDVGRDVPGLDVAVEVSDDVEADEEQTAALVRAVQEIVTNTLRHAAARELWISVARDGDTIRLTASDDGKGAAEVVPGNGLRGIAERFAALGGDIAYDGASGFRVTAWAPVR